MHPSAAPLFDALADRGDAPFLVSADRTTSGADLHAAVLALREKIVADTGVTFTPGEIVALRGRHLALDIVMPLAAWSLGLCVQPIGARETRSSADGLVARSGARYLLAHDASGIWHPLELGGTAPAGIGPGTLLATSGTSGAPRLVHHALAKLVESARAASAWLDLGTEDRLLFSLPAWHVGGLSLLFRAIVSGASLCAPPPGMRLPEALTTFRPTQVSLVATQLKRLLADPAAVACLRACRTVLMGGGPTPAPLRAAALEAGIPLAVGYGATETCAFVAATRDPDLVRGEDVAGHALPGRTITLDADGRILVASPTLPDGYLIDGALVPAVDDAGRWASGDVGSLEGGVLRVHGRADRVFISGGENIQPEEIEEALLALPGVTDAVVVPVPSDEFGTRPVAFVAGDDLTATALDAGVRAVLPGFKAPDAFFRLPPRPEGSLKPDLPTLAALVTDPLAASRLEAL